MFLLFPRPCPSSFCNFFLQTIQLGYASGIRAIRISYMGELGWELHVPTEVSVEIYSNNSFINVICVCNTSSAFTFVIIQYS